MTCCVVCDLGAGSGRVMLARLDGERLALSEVHRFGGYVIERPDGSPMDGPRWDLARLLAEVERGIGLAARTAGAINSIGVDSWGLDYVLLDAAGAMLEEPFHYRHPRSRRGWRDCPLSPAALFAETASQILPVNTVYQLTEAIRSAPEPLRRADRLLMIADAVSHFLTGVARSERTLARTSGLIEAAPGRWSHTICDRIGLEMRLLPEIVEPGRVIGPLRTVLAERLGLPQVPVIAVAAHDTASAVTALGVGQGSGFLILGSWSLVGIEQAEIDRRSAVLAAGFGNEGGGGTGAIGGRPFLVRSLNGLHLIQKLRDSLRRRGADLSFAEIAARAAEADDPGGIDPTDPIFLGPTDMMAAIAAHCAARGRTAPTTVGGAARAIYQGLAVEVAAAVRALEQLTGRPLPDLRVCGGGAQDRLLCTLIAEATGRTLLIGPVEATAWGNAILQLIGLGRLASVAEGRALVARSAPLQRLEPERERSRHARY